MLFSHLQIYPLSCLYLSAISSATVGRNVGQADNFNVSVEIMEAYGCGSKCQEILSITNKADLVTMGTAFDFDFYDTAANFSSSAPGDLLKLAPVDPATLDVPARISVWKMQYTSQEIDGSLVPVSGFIALPFNVPEGSNKIHVVAFAHGTIGVYRGCAPSSSPSLFNYLSWSPIIERGYALVATDYAGIRLRGPR